MQESCKFVDNELQREGAKSSLFYIGGYDMNAQELTKALDKTVDRLHELEKKIEYMEQQVEKLELFKRDGAIDIKQIQHEIDMLKRWRW